MIRVTRLNHVPILLNADLIEHIEVTPDTVISLITGQKMMVLEPANEVVDRIIRFRRSIGSAEVAATPPLEPADLEKPAGGDPAKD
jgi:flagellar protein FlbD